MGKIKQLVLVAFLVIPCIINAHYTQEELLAGLEERRALLMKAFPVLDNSEEESSLAEAEAAVEHLNDEMDAADEQMAAENAGEVKDASKRARRAIKWQNRLLTPASWPVGVYVRDIIEAFKTGGDLTADVLMYRNLLQRRIDTIYTQMTSNYKPLLEVAVQVRQSLELSDQMYEEMDPVRRALTSKVLLRDMQMNPLRTFLWENHRIVKGFNPFTQDTIIPVFLRFVYQKLSDSLSNYLIVNDALSDAGMHAYKVNEQGKYKVCETTYLNKKGVLKTKPQTPYSISNIANTFLNPGRSTFARIFSQSVDWAKNIDLGHFRAIVGIPSWLYSPQARAVGDFAAVGFSAQVFDQVNSIYWQEYVIQNRDKLIDILDNYKQALERFDKGNDEVTYWEQKIKKFIIKGHTPPSWVPGTLLRRWWTAMKVGQIKQTWYAAYPVYIIMVWNVMKVGLAAYKMLNPAAQKAPTA